MSKRISLAGSRVSAGLSQDQMAEKLGVTRQTVSNWENGKLEMKPAYLIAWCTITGFQLSDIFLSHEST